MDNLWGLKLLVDHEKFNGNVPPGQSFYDLKQTLKLEDVLLFNIVYLVYSIYIQTSSNYTQM